MTIAKRVKSATEALSSHSDAPELDAQRIMLHVLGQRDTSYLITHNNDPLSDQQASQISAMVTQRQTGMPLAYILGETDFFGRTFIVTPDVLIPRPDTETLIEKTLEYIKTNFSEHKEITIADICTGSGCIAITLALEIKSKFPDLHYKLIATDISENALTIAKRNAEKHGVLDKIEFLQGDMLEPFDFAQGKPYKIDLIVSNPPYVPTEELAKTGQTIETNGLLFEPRMALDGGPDGLQFVNQIKASGIPAVIETVGGEIILVNT